MIWGLFSRNSVWYPANILASEILHERMTTPQLVSFHWGTFLITTEIAAFAGVLIGLLYGAILPMFPRRPIFLTGFLVPLVGSGIVQITFKITNPELSQRIDWLWFVCIHIASGTVAGFVVSRCERIRTWQHLPFLDRAGIEIDEVTDRSGGPSD